MSDRPILVLFYRDLRIGDHPALTAAVKANRPVVPLYVFDARSPGNWAPGGASRWWLHHALQQLDTELKDLGNRLVIRDGNIVETALTVADEVAADSIYFTRGYEPWWRTVETSLDQRGQDMGLAVKRFGGRLLLEPEEVTTKTGDPYKVYTPFWRSVSGRRLRQPVGPITSLKRPGRFKIKSLKVADLDLRPTAPNWARGFEPIWQPGRVGARAALESFVAERIAGYHEARDRPDISGTSRLSPHLHFGEISPAECWAAASAASAGLPNVGVETFLKEVVWREFSYHLLFHWPDLPEAPFRDQFAAFPWRDDDAALRAWQRGATGYPIVDAGMRELWETGWMHNRVRMIVASFLTKNLLLPWQAGEAWFWDCLVDADLASNAASWQWVAGSGADAAPYFRIFNPVKQGQTYDPDGSYVRRWVPELAKLASRHIHAPWEAPEAALQSADVRLGETYPKPIVDHKHTRDRALSAYATIKSQG
ncbi:MAG: deoxyribodipyrimidine photo-lyase [Pseudomonadota bacterium]